MNYEFDNLESLLFGVHPEPVIVAELLTALSDETVRSVSLHLYNPNMSALLIGPNNNRITPPLPSMLFWLH